MTSTPTADSASAGGMKDFAFGEFAYLQSVEDTDLLAAMQESAGAIKPIDKFDLLSPSNGMAFSTFGDFPNLQNVEQSAFMAQPSFPASSHRGND